MIRKLSSSSTGLFGQTGHIFLFNGVGGRPYLHLFLARPCALIRSLDKTAPITGCYCLSSLLVLGSLLDEDRI